MYNTHYTVTDVGNILSAWGSMYNAKKNAALKEYQANEAEFKAFLASRRSKTAS
jgi:hypothetical protein